MAEQATKEPTMEEILSSIRRIISEDGSPVGEASGADISATATNDDDFLGLGEDLAEANDQDVNVAEGEHLLSVDELLETDSAFTDFEDLTDIDALETAAEPEAPAAETALEEVFDADALDQSVAEIEAGVFADHEPAAPATHAEAEAAISDVMAAASAPEAATPAPVEETPVQETASMTEQNTSAANPLLGAGISGNPIENMVSEMMRPMIKEWIDTNLPGIVERKVEAEIQQVANRVVAALRND